MPKLLITWDPPSDTSDIDSIVLYKKKAAADCEECLDGELIYETSDFTSSGSRYDDQNDEEGEWRYAAFSKNPAGLSPCATNTYTISTDSAPTVSSSLGDVNAEDTSGSMTIDLSSVFIDSEGDLITKTAESSDTDIASVSVDGDTLTLTFTGGQTGTATITVTGTANGLTVTDQFTVTVTAGAQDQTITFADIVDWQIIAGIFNLTATATSGLPVTFAASSNANGLMTIDGNVVTPNNTTNNVVAGEAITITASQAGGTDINGVQWNPAPDVQKTFNLSDPDTDGDGIPDSLDAQPTIANIQVIIDVFPKFQGHNELSFEFVVNSHISSPIADTSTGQITADSTNFLIELATDAGFTNIVKTDNLTALNGIEVTQNNIFKYIHFFDQLVEDTGYWARMTASGGLVGIGTSNAQTPQAGFITNPCTTYNATRNADLSLTITGNPGSKVTVTQETPGYEGQLKGHVRVLATDETQKPWIAIGENSEGGGKVVFDTGWPKFIGYSPEYYNSLGPAPTSYPDTTVRSEPVTGTGWTWNGGYSSVDSKNLGQNTWWQKNRQSSDDVHTGNYSIRPDEQGGLIKWKQSHKAELDSGTSIYDESKMPAWAGYLYNSIRYIQRKTNRTNKILYINDYKDNNYNSGVPATTNNNGYYYYASQKFYTTFRDISEHAGITFEQMDYDTGPGNTWVHGHKLLSGFKNNEAEWKAYLDGYDAVIYLGSEPNSWLANHFINALHSFVADGGGLLVTTDHDFGHGTVNQIVHAYGIQFYGNFDRTNGHDDYKLGDIISNTEYVPFGSHPLFDGISPNNHIHVGKSEGAIAYLGDAALNYNSQSTINTTPISKTSSYTIPSNGSLEVTSHNDSSALTDRKVIISTADDCGSAIP